MKPIYRKFLAEAEYVDYFKRQGKTVPPFLVMQPYVVRDGIPGYMVPCKANDSDAELYEIPVDQQENWMSDTCPVCGKNCIGRTRVGDERNCGKHYWKWENGVKVVLSAL